MEIQIKNFEAGEEGKKLVGLIVTINNKKFLIDKQIPITAKKTPEQYVQEAIEASQPEIDAWVADSALVGKVWDAESKTFKVEEPVEEPVEEE